MARKRSRTGGGATAPRKGLRDRRFAISAAAIRLFTEQGLEGTTVDDITAAAGVAPRTFFRHFATKEEAAFPDHDEMIEELQVKFAERSNAINPLATALELARASASQYLSDPDLYRPRFKLVVKHPALRDRERLIDYRYEMTIAEYLERELADQPTAAMTARALAAGIVAAVNYALYAWAEAPDEGAEAVLEEGLEMLDACFAPILNSAGAAPEAITVTIPASAEVHEALARVLERSLGANHRDSSSRGARRRRA